MEIKCSYSKREVDIQEVMDKSFCLHWECTRKRSCITQHFFLPDRAEP